MKEPAWIDYDTQAIVPKCFIEQHSKGDCLDKQRVEKAFDKIETLQEFPSTDSPIIITLANFQKIKKELGLNSSGK